MPHVARIRGRSGYYHVVPKGIADQLIFENDDDRKYYLRLLGEAAQQTGILVHAYCLMSNHTHLVLEDAAGKLPDAMKYLHERYAMRYASRSGRKGGVFRKPYWSEPIENDSYLLCAVRYVHANPAAAGICPASAYTWSSAKDYLGRRGLTSTALVLDLLGGRDGFIAFSASANSTALPFPGSRLKAHLSDDEAFRIALGIFGRDGLNLAKATREERSAAVTCLAQRGFTTRQIARICNISQSSVARLV